MLAARKPQVKRKAKFVPKAKVVRKAAASPVAIKIKGNLDPRLKHETIAEIERLVPTTVDKFFGPWNFEVIQNPKVEVHIVDSGEPPGGLGEAGTSLIVPAVANAIFAATRKRLRKMPVDAAALKQRD